MGEIDRAESRSRDGVGQEVSGWRLWALNEPTMRLKNLAELLDPAPKQSVGLRNWWCLFLPIFLAFLFDPKMGPNFVILSTRRGGAFKPKSDQK